MNLQHPSAEPLGWKKSFLWLAFAVACFHAAYTSLKYPAAGLFIIGYAYGLVRLTDQPNVRRAFYFGLVTGYLCYAPQTFFMWRIFGPLAIVLWVVLAFWVGLFTAIACGAIRRWGKVKAAWLIPVVWTGVEYFRSELYYLKFSWMNLGYALPPQFSSFGTYHIGMYGIGLVIFASIVLVRKLNQLRSSLIRLIIVFGIYSVFAANLILPVHSGPPRPIITLVGVQLEFPNEYIIHKMLDQALAKNANAPIFVLSEYTLDGGLPVSLKDWCRTNSRYLVVGGKDVVTNDVYYNTAFVVGTNGEIVFQQAKSVPIQFFKDGLPATNQAVWNSPWGKIGICICYDLSYTRVTDRLVEQGAQLIICPTMDVETWGRHQHELHSRVAPVRAAEYGVPIFRVASSGISQAVSGDGNVITLASMPGSGEIFSAQLRLPRHGALPLDRYLAPLCVGGTGIILATLLFLAGKDKRAERKAAVT
jgi:apolipoprotein N-acyltransferase